MAFKKRKEIDEIKAFVEGGDIRKTLPVGSFTNLEEMTADDLAYQMESVFNQSLLMMWMFSMHIRDKFSNNIEMGNFIKKLREQNPYHPLCVVRQQTRNRYIHAGRLATKLGITDLDAIGVSPTAFYELASPKNSDIATKLIHHIKQDLAKKKQTKEVTRTVEYVERLIAQERSILGESQVDTTGNIDVMDYDKPRTELRIVKVHQNIAEDAVIDSVGNLIEDAIAHHEFVPPVALSSPEQAFTAINYGDRFAQSKVVDFAERRSGRDRRINSHEPELLERHGDEFDSHNPVYLSGLSTDDLLLELATRTEKKSAGEIKNDVMLFMERYDLSFSEQENIFEALKKWARTMQA